LADMIAEANPIRPTCYLHNILDTPEHPEIRRLTALVQHLFRVPVAYFALLGGADKVLARIGSGTEYADCLGALRLDNLLAEPQLVRDPACDLPPGTDLQDLRFAASALLHSTSGVQFGVLVIADRVPRPDFSLADFRALGELAGVMAAKMELRLVASLALESELSLRETGRHFCGVADFAPIPLMYSSADGSRTFVNRAWLDFSGWTAEQERANGWVSLIHREYRRAVVKQCRDAFQAHGPFSAEAPVRRRDGVYRWMLGKGAPRFREDGSFDGYVGCLIDLVEYRGAEGERLFPCRSPHPLAHARASETEAP
jgi:PAS domain S-box-containing protein